MARAGAHGRWLSAFVVACALAIASCGDDGDKQSEGCGASHPAHARIYRARALPKAPVTPARVAATVDALCGRVSGRPASQEVSVHRVGADRIEVGSKAPLSPSTARLARGRAGLAFYDWEPNLRPASQFQPTFTTYVAVRTASRQRPTADKDDIPPGGPSDAVRKRLGGDERKIEQYYDRQNDTAGDKYYVFGPGAGLNRQLIAGPSPACGEVKAGGVCLKVSRGITLAKDAMRGGPALGYWILEDDSELSSADITDPKQAFDSATNEPIVTFQLTARGRAAFARVTKREAERGAHVRLRPGQPSQDAFQRFAIVLDDQLVSLATINYLDNPEGIPGDNGVQINGIGDIQETRDLARSLAYSPLPLRLELIGVR